MDNLIRLFLAATLISGTMSVLFISSGRSLFLSFFMLILFVVFAGVAVMIGQHKDERNRRNNV